jgi:predicted RecB family nuclease
MAGKIIGMDGTAHTVNLGNSSKDLLPLLEPLQEWTTTASPEPPPIILNKHCPLCPFQRLCQAQAVQEDNLSRLRGVTPKVVRNYERKGIFTVNSCLCLKPQAQKAQKS